MATPPPAGNPQFDLGFLNRIKAAVQFVDYPQLNATSSFLGRSGIRIASDGPASINIPAMTGAVISAEPYQLRTVSIPLLKTMNLANVYIAQVQKNTAIGDINVIPDATPMQQISLTNCSIINWDTEALDGTDPVVMVTVQGTYSINNSMWA